MSEVRARRAYEYKREQVRAARKQARYLRELRTIATCGLPMQFTGYHYGTHQVSPDIAMRVADQYPIWADECDAIITRLESEMEAMFRGDLS